MSASVAHPDSFRHQAIASIQLDTMCEEIMCAGFAITAAGQTIDIWGRPIPTAVDELRDSIGKLSTHLRTLELMQKEFGS